MMYNFFMQEVNFDVIILGGGPSGLTSAIYTSRSMLKTLVIAGNPPGGQLMVTSDVENFPGFPSGITGPELINSFRKQAEKFGCTILDENAVSVKGSFTELFSISTDSNNIYKAKSVIVATGASAKWLGLDSEKKLIGRGLSACATCDGFFFKNKNIAVVGGGDAAMEEAVYLTKYAKEITVLVRGDKDKMKASKIMQERAFSNPKIKFIFNHTVSEILGDNSVKGIKIKNTQSNEERLMPDIEGLFVAIGHSPNTKFLEGVIELDSKGYIKIYNGFRTSVEGIFASGDVADYKYRQAVTASGYGCMAALDAVRFLSEHGIEVKPSGY